MKKIIKRLFFGKGIQERKIKFGVARGIKMKINLEHKIQRYLGLEEREVQSWFKKFAPETSVFVDIGASDGFYGLVYYKLNSEGQQYLCDAIVAYADEQRANFRLSGFSLEKINIVSRFIGDATTDTHISLDELLKSAPGNVFLKIDVDGGELSVLKGVQQVLRSRNCKIVVETHSKQLEEDCTAYLQQLGYKTKIIPNAWWRLFIPELRPMDHNRWFSAWKA